MEETQELMITGVAGQYLADFIPSRSAQQWALWLQNNRNPARASLFRVPYVKLGGGVFYDKVELDSFVQFERGRQLGAIRLTGRAAEVVHAMGIGQAGGSTTGRTLSITSVLGQVDEVTQEPFVQFVMTDPFLIFRLSPDQARTVASALLDAASDAEQEAARHGR